MGIDGNLDVLPHPSRHDAPDVRVSNIKHLCDTSTGDALGVESAYLHNIMFAQLDVRALGPAPKHIASVVLVSAQDDVRGVHAPPVVAGVPGNLSFRYLAVLNLCHDTMSVLYHPSIADTSVSGVIDIPFPSPALRVTKTCRGTGGDSLLPGKPVRKLPPDRRSCKGVPVPIHSSAMGGAETPLCGGSPTAFDRATLSHTDNDNTMEVSA